MHVVIDLRSRTRTRDSVLGVNEASPFSRGRGPGVRTSAFIMWYGKAVKLHITDTVHT